MRLRRKTCMDEKLRESEERFRQVAENAQEWIWEVDSNGLYTYSSPVVERILGYSSEEVIREKHFYDFFFPQEREKQKEAAFGIFARKQPFRRFVNKNLHKNGNEVILETSGIPILDSNGKLLGYRGIDLDVTERWKMEGELKEINHRLKMLLETAREGIITADPLDKITFANKAFADMLGYGEEELLNLDLRKLVDEQGAKRIIEETEVRKSGRISRYELVFCRKDGKLRTVQATASPLWNEDGSYAGALGIMTDVTERKNVEKALLESQQKFERLFKSQPDPTVFADMHDCFLDVNPRFVEVFGYSPDEVRGKALDDLLVPEDKKEEARMLAKKSTEEYVSYETARRRKDGSTIPVSLSAAPIIVDGQFAGSVVTYSDITERKQMEKQLRESEERFRGIAERNFDAIVTADSEGRITYVSPSIERILGFQAEEIIGQHFQEYFAGSGLTDALQTFSRLLKGETVEGLQLEMLRKDGTLAPIEVNVSPIIAGGEMVGIQAITRDITERKKMEEKIKESEERLRRLIEFAPDAIYVNDVNGNFVEGNRLAEEMTGYEKEELIGRNMIEVGLLPEKYVPRALEALSKNLQGEKTGPDEFELIRKDGRTVTVEISTFPVKREGKTEILGIARDIAERKQMMKKLEEYSQHLEELVEQRTSQLKDAHEQLVKGERLATIGQVAAMVGHDLRNPLTGISGAAYFLKTRLGPEADKKTLEMLELIEKDIQYSNKIITDLMEYSREIKLELAETNPSSIMKEALPLVEIPCNVQVLNSTQDYPRMRMDAEKMKRVFVNLIRNAIDAMPQGGRLSISSRKAGSSVEFAFIDIGIGITEEVREKIWMPFFTTKSKGMGLGLAICKRIVEAHEGKISVESTVGGGTTFTVTVPIKLKPEEEGGEEVCVNAPESLLSTTTKASEKS